MPWLPSAPTHLHSRTCQSFRNPTWHSKHRTVRVVLYAHSAELDAEQELKEYEKEQRKQQMAADIAAREAAVGEQLEQPAA